MTPKKKNEKPQTDIHPQGAERFTIIVWDAWEYRLLGIYIFEDIKYQVVAVLNHKDGFAIEFVRVQ